MDGVVAKVQLHEVGEVHEGVRDFSRDVIVCEVEHGELREAPYVGGDLAVDEVAGEVKDLEEREFCDAGRDVSRNALPVGDCDAGELREVAYGGGDVAGHHVTATEGDIRYAARGGVARDAVPAVAAIGASP